MSKLLQNHLKNLMDDILLEFNNKESLTKLSEDFDVILSQMDIISEINTKDVEPMHFPFEYTQNYLRDDNFVDSATVEEIFSNVPEEENNFIIINKVVG